MSIWDLIGRHDDEHDGLYDEAWERRLRDRQTDDRLDQGIGDYEPRSLIDVFTGEEDAAYTADLQRRLDDARREDTDRATWPRLEQPEAEERGPIAPRFTIGGRTVTAGEPDQQWDTYPPQRG